MQISTATLQHISRRSRRSRSRPVTSMREAYIDIYYQSHASDTGVTVKHENDPCPMRQAQQLELSHRRHHATGQGSYTRYSHVSIIQSGSHDNGKLLHYNWALYRSPRTSNWLGVQHATTFPSILAAVCIFFSLLDIVYCIQVCDLKLYIFKCCSL